MPCSWAHLSRSWWGLEFSAHYVLSCRCWFIPSMWLCFFNEYVASGVACWGAFPTDRYNDPCLIRHVCVFVKESVCQRACVSWCLCINLHMSYRILKSFFFSHLCNFMFPSHPVNLNIPSSSDPLTYFVSLSFSPILAYISHLRL